ncbi:MAG TPA: DUF4230 domain-containing protein [Herpetosiphonaceae bacterium]|nr:DUF4230 domain-containing protein [Herpetosiphonaceae bacterium]
MRRNRNERSIRSNLMLILGIALVGVVAYTFLAPGGGGSGILPAPTSTFRPGPTVIQAIQRKANLETVQMTISGDVTVERVHGLFGVCSETLTYLAYYNVSAGIDLSQIGSQNVQVSNDGFPDRANVVITLPAPQILHNELDTANSRIVSQETPKWVPGCSHEIADMTVEAQDKLRAYAESAARDKGILDQAQANAGEELQRLLNDSGYANVTIRYADDLPGTPVPTAER